MDWSLGTGRPAKCSRPFPAGDILASLGEEQRFALFETSRAGVEGNRSLLFVDPRGLLTAHRPEEIEGFFEKLQAGLEAGLWAAGFFSYELGYHFEPVLARSRRSQFPLAWFGLFDAPFTFDGESGSFTPPLPFTPRRANGPAGFSIDAIRLSVEKSEYRRALETIRRLIARGDTYQVNYTMKYRFRFRGAPSALYLSLRDNQPVPYGAFLRTGERDVLSASPELFFRLEGERITARPMKGTAARGRNDREDLALAIGLATDAKNRAENIMITDLLRNDLGRICRPGTIAVSRPCHVEPYDRLFQMTSSIEGKLDGPVSIRRILEALFPCGSVTGAPKIRTMEIIGDLEREERGVYCGALGFISPGREAAFSVPIRTVVLEGERGEMGVGSGIVIDSEGEAEYEECRLKGRFLERPHPPRQLVETLRWESGSGFSNLDEHLSRLATSARLLGFGCPLPEIRRSLREAVSPLDERSPHRVRLLLDRSGICRVSSSPLDPAPPAMPAVHLSATPVDSSDPDLYHKTTRRPLYERELEAARRAGFFEVLFMNEHGELTEGAFTNIFLERGALLFTPPVGCGLLDGILRRRLLRDEPERVREGKVYPRDLEGKNRLFVGNSVRGLLEVRFHKASLPSGGVPALQ